ncbi:mammalian cell entry protein [Mycobacterium sp. CBMA 234]|uniref:virulence factor Mce family protein n=1 Tax=Mycolicibacterium sp. CBMA 234 TaxID=1918495 RepID=UPI0012DE4BE7|nr:virulence factor Mce family protein [Mycolicibacterium sp. CBMA 234]MUL65955.1 mammalian cell entry protein [Mycolicibacterium sp. CBMA 234]
MRRMLLRCSAIGVAAVLASTVSGCEWHGLNSLPLPGTEGNGDGAYTVQAQFPDIGYIQPNSRVRVGDVTVGNVSKIERQGWHALVTMTLNKDVHLPANATATIGQTSLLGSLHVELAPPTGLAPEGELHDGSVIPLAHAGAHPSTEQTLAALSVMLNGGGVGEIEDITKTFSTAFAGRADDLRNLITQLNEFVGHVNDQTQDIITATSNLNGLVGQLAEQKPVLDTAARTLPDALAVLNKEKDHLTDALKGLGNFLDVATSITRPTKDSLIKALQDLIPVLESLANAGPALTRSLSFLGTFPWPKETVNNWVRGDYANLTAVIDLTLSRLDSALFTGTRWEGNLTELEMQWGRTIGQLPSPYTAANPLLAPYHFDQGH